VRHSWPEVHMMCERTVCRLQEKLHTFQSFVRAVPVIPFFGAFAKVRKATTGFIKEQLGSHYTDFREILHCKLLLKSKETNLC